MTTTATSDDPQTVWKRIKVPPALAAAGWKLEKRDSSAPYALVNKKLNQDTGGYPDPQEAIEAADALQIEADEAAAIAADGGAPEDQERPATMPIALVDEGWRLQRKNRLMKGGRFTCYAERAVFYGSKETDRTTADYDDPADAILEAIKLERERQAEIEARETGVAVFPSSNEGEKNATRENGNGGAPPAELLLELDRIRLDGGTQQRALFDPAVVEDYAEQMDREEFPAVDVFFDGESYWLADGFYRVHATAQLNRAAIKAHVREGGQRAAILFSLSANARHGLRRTPEDKRQAVLAMLRDSEWVTWSDAVIAEHVRVSVPTVRKLRRQEAAAAKETSAPEQPTKRRGRDGRVQETKRIGKQKTADQEEQLPLATPPEETDAPEASAPPPAAATKPCSKCGRPLSASDYCGEGGRCWDCAGKDQKRPRRKQKEPAPARPSVAELSSGRRVFVSFTWEPGKQKTVKASAAIELSAPRSITIPNMVVWGFLPDAVIALLETIAHKLPKDQAAAKKTATNKASAAKPKRKPPQLARATKKTTAARAPQTTAKTIGRKRASAGRSKPKKQGARTKTKTTSKRGRK